MGNTPIIRKQVTIDLQEYGASGQIVLEELSASRECVFNNNRGMCIIMDPETKQTYTRLGDLAIYTRLAFIVQAPFMSSPAGLSKENWLKFVDRLPDSGKALSLRIDDEIRTFMNLRAEGVTPLAESEEAETQE